MYHRIGSLLPDDAAAASHFAQLYIYDTEHEVQNRLHIMPSLDAAVLTSLQQMLNKVNPYVAVFCQVCYILDQEPSSPMLSMVIKAHRAGDPHCYNTLTADEVAAIMVGAG